MRFSPIWIVSVLSWACVSERKTPPSCSRSISRQAWSWIEGLTLDSQPSEVIDQGVISVDQEIAEALEVTTGVADEFTYYGLCQLRASGERNLLANDGLSEVTLGHILSRTPGYEFILDTQGTPGLFLTGTPGEFS